MDEYAEGYEPEITFRKYEQDRDAEPDEVPAIVAFLRTRAGAGPVLELGVGRGRIAVPLSSADLRVDGIEISTPVVEQLRQVPGGDRIAVTVGNFAHVPYPDQYSLIYVVANALLNLYSQEDQIQCFRNVAAHLTEGGVFVVSGFGPAFIRELDGKARAESISADRVLLETHRHDAATQIIEWGTLSLAADGVKRMRPIVQRYIWPSEMDLMAQIAGLRLQERWGGWSGQRFSADSMMQLAVYGR